MSVPPAPLAIARSESSASLTSASSPSAASDTGSTAGSPTEVLQLLGARTCDALCLELSDRKLRLTEFSAVCAHLDTHVRFNAFHPIPCSAAASQLSVHTNALIAISPFIL